MSSMFPTFTRKFGWFTLTLPDSLITKFLLTKGGVESFGFSHFLSQFFGFCTLRFFGFGVPFGSRFSFFSTRFSVLGKLKYKQIVGFSVRCGFGSYKFIGFQFLRPLEKQWTWRSLKSFGATQSHMKETAKRALHTVIPHTHIIIPGRDLVPQAQHNFPSFAPCTGNSRQSWILDSEPWIPDWGTAFQSLIVEIGFWILFVRGFWIPWAELWIPKPRILDSTSKIFVDSRFQNSDSLQWGDLLKKYRWWHPYLRSTFL